MDSGIGGIPYMLWIREHLPAERLVYFADHAYFPYGCRSREEIVEIVLRQAQKILKQENPKIFVLACNSASVSALEPLRKAVKLPVVGVVPAIKPAAEQITGGTVGVLATERTVKDPYLQNLIDHFANNVTVVMEAAPDLVHFAEEEFLTAEEDRVDEILSPHLMKMMEQGVERLVLGCTHFTFFDEAVRRVSAGHMEPVDSREGVGRQVERVLSGEGHLSETLTGEHTLYTSREKEGNFYPKLADKYLMRYGGLL